ncbi:hypothetical protein H5V45_06160 [Nocardioides sp. KIGAM211]|uniref:Calx-beta domain-containing protein n=1 Tax=Nocardioides luti TaxID=2761101 RepID=A0A7X0REN9_9ACTN|nr:Calx-beta domain-containing protein [Nocardioides luti]MBB6626901.1 hypothetical protein [Nocardioides luti]
MRTTRLLLPTATAVLVTGLLVAAPAHAAPDDRAGGPRTNLAPTRVDLGTLGGATSSVSAVSGTVVVGSAEKASGRSHAFAYDLAASRPHMIDLGTLGGATSSAGAVTGSIVVGTSETGGDYSHAFAYDLAADRPHMVDLGSIRGHSVPTLVDGSVVVGEFGVPGADRDGAFAYDLAADDPHMIDLGSLGGQDTHARALDGSVVVGFSEAANGTWHAFAYDLAADDPHMIDLGNLGGASDLADAVDVDGSIVVGYAGAPSGNQQHAFAYDLSADQPHMTDLGTLEGGPDSSASAIHGTVVTGMARTAAGDFRAFSYDLAAADPVMRGLGADGVDTFITDAEAGVVVGDETNYRMDFKHKKNRAVAFDLADGGRRIDLGTVPGGESSAVATSGVDGDLVLGYWNDTLDQRGNPRNRHPFVYDLSADRPRLVDIDTYDSGAEVVGLDGTVAVGTTQHRQGRRATAWILRRTTRPVIAFRSLDQVVEEGARRATVKVTRYGRTDRAVTVRYRTQNGVARAGQDFRATSGTLRFGRGVTTRTITVRILDDRRREPEEGLLLRLSSPGGGALLGTPDFAHLRIQPSDR